MPDGCKRVSRAGRAGIPQFDWCLALTKPGRSGAALPASGARTIRSVSLDAIQSRDVGGGQQRQPVR